MTTKVRNLPFAERDPHRNANYGQFAVGDRVQITASLRGHVGKFGTIAQMNTSMQMFPWLVAIDGGPHQLYSAAALRYVEGGAQ